MSDSTLAVPFPDVKKPIFYRAGYKYQLASSYNTAVAIRSPSDVVHPDCLRSASRRLGGGPGARATRVAASELTAIENSRSFAAARRLRRRRLLTSD